MYNVAFFFHILGVLLFVAGIVVAGAAFEAARRRQRPAEVALLLGLTRVGVLLVAVGGVLAGVFGLWLVHLGHWRYGSAWVVSATALYLLVLLLGGLGGRRPKRRGSSLPDLPAKTGPSVVSCARCSMIESPGWRTTARCCSSW